MEHTPSEIEVAPVPREYWREALLELLNGVSGQERELVAASLLAAGTSDGGLEGLLEARRGSQFRGVILVREEPGRVASLMGPRLVDPTEEATAAALIRAAGEFARFRRLSVIQSLLPVDTEQPAQWLKAGGFEYLADLEHYVWDDVAAPPLSESLRRESVPLEFCNPGTADTERLERVVDATYQGTLDCPQLNGVRQTRDVLQGYRSCGTHDPGLWFLARRAGDDVGCLFLTRHASTERGSFGTLELVYMGLLPEFRGQGHGRSLLEHALSIARREGKRLVLAVDVSNLPAVHLYCAKGFMGLTRHAVWLKIVAEPPRNG